MKPESKKKNRANAAKSNWGKQDGTDSSFDLTKISEALNFVEGNPVNADESLTKQNESKSSFDFTKMSDALFDAEKNDKTVAALKLMASKRKEAIRMKHKTFCVAAMSFLNLREKQYMETGDRLQSLQTRFPIMSRLKRIVTIHDSKSSIRSSK